MPVSLLPEGLSRHLERNIGFLTPLLWIGSCNELSSIPGAAIVPAALFFGPGASLRMAKTIRAFCAFIGRDQGFFPRRARAKRHIPSALMASITLI